jgi:hypothetical protein
MPFQVPPVADELDALAAYLAQQQDAFRSVVHGLTDEQAGLRPTPSTICLGSLVKHVTFVQRGWLEQALHAPAPVPPTGEDRNASWQEAWTWSEGDTLEQALSSFDAVSQGVVDAARSVDPDLPVPVPPAPWNPTDIDAWSVRWVWLHLIEELARHAGHGDIIREAIDGATTYALVAAREGMPETPWLKPWRPAQPPPD